MTSRVAIASLALLAFGPKMPEGCAKMLEKPARPEPTAPAPTPVTVTSATPPGPTAPPVWHPPDDRPGPTPPSVELAKLRAASEKKDWKTVRSIANSKLAAGTLSDEEAMYLHEACSAQKDKECLGALEKRGQTSMDPKTLQAIREKCRGDKECLKRLAGDPEEPPPDAPHPPTASSARKPPRR